MMKVLPVFLLLSLVVFSCRAVKQVQSVPATATKVDTVVVMQDAGSKKNIEKDTSSHNTKAPAARDLKADFEKVTRNNINFTTFNAKVRVEFESKEGKDNATAYVRLRKDSLMWLSLRGDLGIEGMRVLITPDSVRVINLLKKHYQVHPIGYLQQITGIPFDFSTLQDFVVGNPVFIDSNVVSSTVVAGTLLNILMQGEIFNNLVSLDHSDSKMLHSKLMAVDTTRNRSADIDFSNYENTQGVRFATARKIMVAEQNKFNVNFEFKQYSFNQPITFPFNIPKNYKKL